MPAPVFASAVIVSQLRPMLLPVITFPGLNTVIASLLEPIMLRPLIVQLGADDVMMNVRNVAPPFTTTLGPRVFVTPLAVVFTSVPSILVPGARIGGRLPLRFNDQKVFDGLPQLDLGLKFTTFATGTVEIPAKLIVAPVVPCATLSLFIAVMASRKLTP